MKNPFFSIILPTYNRDKFISSAIISVIKQNFKNWELIIIDDGSTDKTKEIVLSYNDKRILYYFQENQERSIARNNGILHAKAEWICFLDSDDEFSENHLSTFYETISKTKSNLIITGTEVLKNDFRKKIDLEQLNTNSQTFFFRNSIVPGRICVRNTILQEFKFDPEFRISEDTDLFVRISCKYPQIEFTKKHTFIYRFHNDNSINYEKHNAYFERKISLNKILAKKEIEGLNKKIALQTINDCNFGIVKFYFSNNQKMRAYITIIKSIIEAPFYRTKEKLYLLYNINSCIKSS